MSIVPKENVEVIAQSIGINNLSPDVALALAPDIEYRLREVMQVILDLFCHNYDMGLFCHCCFQSFAVVLVSCNLGIWVACLCGKIENE